MLPSADPRVAYIGNNSTGTYPWTWLVFEATDLHVAVLSNASPQILTVLTLGTDYTIQNPELQLENSNGGYIVLTSSGFFSFNNGILPTGYALVIRRSVVFGQDTTLNSQGLYDPASIEGALDFLAMQTIQLQDALARCVQMPLDDYATAAQDIPVASLRAGQFMAFDNNGNPISSPGTLVGVTASSNGATLVQTAGAFGLTIGQQATQTDVLTLLGLNYGIQVAVATIGVASNYAFTLPFLPSAGIWMWFSCEKTNVGVTQFQVNGGTPVAVTTSSAGNISNGSLTSGRIYLMMYDGVGWRIMI